MVGSATPRSGNAPGRFLCRVTVSRGDGEWERQRDGVSVKWTGGKDGVYVNLIRVIIVMRFVLASQLQMCS